MLDEEIGYLKNCLENNSVAWCPDKSTFRIVKEITTHAEENDNSSLCAIFERGEYVALYNCDLSDFAIFKRL